MKPKAAAAVTSVALANGVLSPRSSASLKPSNNSQDSGNGKFSSLCKKMSLKEIPTASQRKKVPWSVVCGVMLFALSLISLFTGHVASDLDWYSHKLVGRSLYSSMVECRTIIFFRCLRVSKECLIVIRLFCLLSYRSAVVLNRLIFGSPSTRSSTAGAAKEGLISLVSRRMIGLFP